MPFMDNKLVLSDNQAITGDEHSDYFFDLEEYGAADMMFDRLWVNIRVGATDFNTLTSLDFAFYTDDDSAFGSPTTILTVNRALASLTAGAVVISVCIPTYVMERYFEIYYNVNGSNPSTGNIDAWLGFEPIMHDITVQKDPLA